jgi:energy-coupling factor transporter ATP-binding protein EcfA2
MRISAITVQNFLGLPDFRHALAHPFLFVSGPNGSGKSSLQDAIKFALVAELPRGLKTVADRAAVITDGAAAGFVALKVDGYDIRRNIGSGKVDGDNPFEITPALAICLDSTRFTTMDEPARRRWLFDLVGVQVNREEVGKQLAANKIPAHIIERVLPLLRDGFPAAMAYAKDEATKARGEWKGITGEAYGSLKGASWACALPDNPPTAQDIEDTRRYVHAAEQKVQVLSEAKGRADAALPAEKVAELKRLAALQPEREAAVELARTTLDQARDQLHALEAQVAPAQPVAPAPLVCPDCKAELVLSFGQLTHATAAPPPPKQPANLTGKINGAKQAVTLAQRDLDDAKTALSNSNGAQVALDNLPTPTPEDLSAPALLEEAKAQLAVHRNALELLEDAQRRTDTATDKTTRAQDAHLRVVDWVATEAQLSPDGIPATLLARALDPVNDELAKQAEAAGFRKARIERALSLSYTERPYALTSESERWRADALFSVVAAIVSGYRIVTLDRFDVLDPESRGEVVDWLLDLTTDGTLETVLLTGTLKAAPDLGDGVDVVWLGEAK